MVSGISTGTNYSYLLSSSTSSSNSSSSSALTTSQQQTLDQILSKYDPTSLTQTDAKQIVSALQDAGIKPSKALEETMEASGFDAVQIGQLAGLKPQNQAQNGMPPPPPPSKEEQDSVLAMIESLFANSSNTNSSSSISSTNSSTNFLDQVSDYTSRILTLNDTAKQSVLDLFDKYSSQNSNLSTQDAATVIKTQLSQILGDSSNYNHSFTYA